MASRDINWAGGIPPRACAKLATPSVNRFSLGHFRSPDPGLRRPSREGQIGGLRGPQRARIQGQKARFETQRARFEPQRARFEAQRARFEAQRARFEAQKPRFDAQSSRFEAQRARSEAQKPRFEAPEGSREPDLRLQKAPESQI